MSGSSDEQFGGIAENNGRNRAPNEAQINIIPDSALNVPRHPYFSIKNETSGAIKNVPTPDPDKLIPFVSK